MKRIEKNVAPIPPAPAPRINNSIKVRQYTLSGDYMATYDSMSEAGKAIGGFFGGVWKCVHGEMKSYKGFQFKRVEE